MSPNAPINPVRIQEVGRDLLGRNFEIVRSPKGRKRKDEVLWGFIMAKELRAIQVVNAWGEAFTPNQASPLIGSHAEALAKKTLNECSNGAFKVERITHFWVNKALEDGLPSWLKPDLVLMSDDPESWTLWEVKTYRDIKWPLVHAVQLATYRKLEELGIGTWYFLFRHSAEKVSPYLVSDKKKEELREMLNSPRALFTLSANGMHEAYENCPMQETAYWKKARDNGDFLKRIREEDLKEAQAVEIGRTAGLSEIYSWMHEVLWIAPKVSITRT